MSNLIKLHRVICATPEAIYRAYLEPAAMVKWLPPHGYVAKVHYHDAQVGGTYRMSFIELATGLENTFGGKYLELVPNQRIRSTDVFDDPNLSGEMEVLVELKAVSVGTEITITQTGIPDEIPVEDCYVGWQQSIHLLELLLSTEKGG